MYLNFIPPAMLLIAAAMSTPVQLPAVAAANTLLHRRQISTLGPLLKGIMDQNSGSPAAPAPALAVPSAGTAPVPARPPYHEDCADAIQKIDDALNTSEQYMRASRKQPTIGDIQAVLAVLAGSLAEDCAERNPLDGMPVSGSPKTTAMGLEPRESSTQCSDCERQLYGIVKGLQQILAMTKQGMGEAQVSSVVGSAMSMSATATMVTTSITVAVTTPTTMAMAVTGRA